MWRVMADGDAEILDAFEQRYYRERNNPMETLRDDDFLARYRFPKDVVANLVDIVEPAIERHTHR